MLAEEVGGQEAPERLVAGGLDPEPTTILHHGYKIFLLISLLSPA